LSNKILVIGASGRVGGELVKWLVGKGLPVRAATRNPAAISVRFQNSVEAVGFDYDRPETFAPALAGVEKVFLSVRPGDNHSDLAAMPLVDAAKKAGVQRIVDLTAMGVERDDTFMLRILERYVEASGIPFTHLRPNWFMQNFDSGPIYHDLRATGAIHLPAADAKISFIDLRDIAAVAGAALTEPGHSGQAYTLTGIEAISYFQVAEKLSRVSGQAIAYAPIGEDMARAGLVRGGVADDLIERWLDFYRIVRQGLCSTVSTDFESVVGRTPGTFDRYAVENAASWKGNI
jgi:uncharacterized protein YbjT (DUF2867 family)